MAGPAGAQGEPLGALVVLRMAVPEAGVLAVVAREAWAEAVQVLPEALVASWAVQPALAVRAVP